MCGAAWLVPDSAIVPPFQFAPVISPPGAKILVSVALRWENEMIRSGPVEKSVAPPCQDQPPSLLSHTAPTDHT